MRNQHLQILKQQVTEIMMLVIVFLLPQLVVIPIMLLYNPQSCSVSKTIHFWNGISICPLAALSIALLTHKHKNSIPRAGFLKDWLCVQLIACGPQVAVAIYVLAKFLNRPSDLQETAAGRSLFMLDFREANRSNPKTSGENSVNTVMHLIGSFTSVLVYFIFFTCGIVYLTKRVWTRTMHQAEAQWRHLLKLYGNVQTQRMDTNWMDRLFMDTLLSNRSCEISFYNVTRLLGKMVHGLTLIPTDQRNFTKDAFIDFHFDIICMNLNPTYFERHIQRARMLAVKGLIQPQDADMKKPSRGDVNEGQSLPTTEMCHFCDSFCPRGLVLPCKHRSHRDCLLVQLYHELPNCRAPDCDKTFVVWNF